MLRLYRLIATMDATAPLPSLADQEPTWASASSLARTWGLNQLADRLMKRYDLAARNVRMVGVLSSTRGLNSRIACN